MSEDGRDSADVFIEIIKTLFVTVMTTIIDCLEESFNCMTVVGGKNLIYTVIITWSFVPVTGLFKFLGYPTMISWQDSLVASFIIVIISTINGAGKMMLDKSILKMKQVKEVYESYKGKENSNEQRDKS